MLKLKRVSRDQPIQVLVRDQSRLFSGTFRIAFGLAVSLHALAFILFQVGPFKLHVDGKILLPIQVESDLSLPQDLSESLVLAAIERDLIPLRDYLEPMQTAPALPKLPKPLLLRQMEYIKEENLLSNPFLTLENNLLNREFSNDSGSASAPVVMHVSGNLSNWEVVDAGYQDKVLPAEPGQFRVLYSVQVEGNSGRVFWFEAKQSARVPALDKLAEKILMDMQFIQKPELFVSSGEIEINFTIDRP